MSLFKSLGARFAVTVLVTAIVSFSVFVGLTIYKLDSSIDAQSTQIKLLSEQQYSKKLLGHTRLAIADLIELANLVTRRLESISQRADLMQGVTSNNVVAMSETLGRAAKSADLDGIIVVDNELNAIGAHSGETQLLAVNQYLQTSELAQALKYNIKNNDRRNLQVYQKILQIDGTMLTALGATQASQFMMVSAVPLFDDYGEVIATLIAHRSLKPSEAGLQELAKIEGGSFVVRFKEQMISASGTPITEILPIEENGIFHYTPNKQHIGKCTPLLDLYEICAFVPVKDLLATTNTMVKIAQSEEAALIKWLLLVSAASLVVFAMMALFTIRQVTRPIKNITEAVLAVAHGDWKSQIVGANRVDEIGDIARAVVMLQQSMEERDKLKIDIANAETLNQRRLALEESIHKFDGMMRSVLLSVSDSAESMEQIAQELARVSSITEGEAAEVAFVTDHTLSHVSKMANTTKKLGMHFWEKTDASVVNHLSENFKFTQLLHKLNDASATINSNMLNSIVERSSNPKGEIDLPEFNLMAQSISDIIALNLKTIGSVGSRLQTDQRQEYHLLAHELGFVVQCMQLIRDTIQHQETLINDINAGMKVTTTGTMNVASTVARLKQSMEQAKNASIKVVSKAEEMSEEAHKLDLTVKSFLREVSVHENIQPSPPPTFKAG